MLLALAGVVALHVLSPEFLPLRHSLSQYANGSFGWLFGLALALFAVGLGALAYSVTVEFAPAARAPFGAFLLILATFSLLFAAFFPADPGDAATSITGRIHAFSLNSGTVVTLIAALLIGNKLRQLTGWTAWLSLALALAAGVAAVLGWRAPLGASGLHERALYAVLAAWVIVTALVGPVQGR